MSHKLIKNMLVNFSCVCVLFAVQSVMAQTVTVLPGLSYTVKNKSSTPNATVTEFAEISAQLTGADGKKISSKYIGDKTLSMQMLKTKDPSLARMILLTPIGETRVWTLSANNMPADVVNPKSGGQLTLHVIATPDLLKAPSNLMLPPSSAIRTASGLRYIVLKKGNVSSHPKPTSIVTIDYSGWDRSGRLFDSSVARGEPSSFALTGLIQGWKEGVVLMSPGDTFRFWIPGSLAYDGISGGDSPKGQLVFDITLYDFKDTP
jgi:hypothetical protein